MTCFLWTLGILVVMGIIGRFLPKECLRPERSDDPWDDYMGAP